MRGIMHRTRRAGDPGRPAGRMLPRAARTVEALEIEPLAPLTREGNDQPIPSRSHEGTERVPASGQLNTELPRLGTAAN